jgi:hypothetical protein
MGKFDLSARHEAPFKRLLQLQCARDLPIDLARIIPQAAWVPDLRRGAPEEYRVELRVAENITKRLKK